MPSKGTDRQTFRLDRGVWDEFGETTSRTDPPSDRASVLRDFIRWYNRERGAKLPARPPAADPGRPPQ